MGIPSIKYLAGMEWWGLQASGWYFPRWVEKCMDISILHRRHRACAGAVGIHEVLWLLRLRNTPNKVSGELRMLCLSHSPEPGVHPIQTRPFPCLRKLPDHLSWWQGCKWCGCTKFRRRNSTEMDLYVLMDIHSRTSFALLGTISLTHLKSRFILLMARKPQPTESVGDESPNGLSAEFTIIFTLGLFFALRLNVLVDSLNISSSSCCHKIALSPQRTSP